MTTDGKGSQLEQVVKYCVLHRYALNSVTVLETATKFVHEPLLKYIKEAIQ
jgi:hypothetical protein